MRRRITSVGMTASLKVTYVVDDVIAVAFHSKLETRRNCKFDGDITLDKSNWERKFDI